MIVVSAISIFAALFILVRLAWPGNRVKKRRLGIERGPVNLGRSLDSALGEERRRRLSQALALAGSDTAAGDFVLRIAAVSIVLAIGGLLITPVLALVGLVAPYLCARSWLAHKGHKRQELFSDQLPDFLRSLVMSLRAGFGLTQAIETAVSEAKDPIRVEIERVLAEVRMGRSLSEAMAALAQRMGNEDLVWVVGAIEINRETGGNLSEVLAAVNTTIRERGRLQRKVSALTSEGIFSAKILTTAPFLFALWQWRAHPDGFSWFYSGTGLLVMIALGALMTVGWFWIKRVVTIKV
jgi:tight adherence protein B